jgi:hypothetical protein
MFGAVVNPCHGMDYSIQQLWSARRQGEAVHEIPPRDRAALRHDALGPNHCNRSRTESALF